MLPYARFRLSDDTEATLVPGEIIGRMAGAALHLDDARVSEAHAMVSLRGGELKLLALRGRFTVDGPPLSDLVLVEGQEIFLARDLSLTVVDVGLPDAVLALEGPGLPRQILGGVTSLKLRPRPRLTPKYAGDADAWFYTSAEGWRMRLPEQGIFPLEPGPVRIGEQTFQVVEVALEAAGPQRTRVAGGVSAALEIVANYDTVHVRREGHPAVVLNGRQARIVSELVTIGAPCSWESIAPSIWPDAEDRNHLRRKWDITLAKMRSKLKAKGVRPGLVQADGKGNFELVLNPGDRVTDNT